MNLSPTPNGNANTMSSSHPNTERKFSTDRSAKGLDEERVKEYIRDQDQQDKRTDGNQLDLGW